MKTTYFLISHKRGNHSANQVYYHGSTITEGTKKECNEELIRMRKFCRSKWHETSTNDTQKDFVSYEMGDIFFVKKDENGINWA